MGTGTAAAAPAIELRHSVRFSRLSDELLARYAARGSARAFAALYERYHQQLYRYCRSIVHDDADAQDALQATFAGALSALRRQRRNAPLRPWLFRIAHNEAISVLRQRRRQETPAVSIAPTAAPSTEELVAERARWAELMSDIDELPERQRSALLLRELSGLSHDEIAIAVDTSVSGAKQAIFEARQALLEFGQGRAMSCEDICRRLSEGDRRVLRGRRVRAHLRACSGCAAFATAIPERRAQLRALMPVLPPAAAVGLLQPSLHGSTVTGVAATGTTATGTATVSTAAVGTAVASKVVVGAALLVSAAGGAVGVSAVLPGHHSAAALPSAHIRHHGSTDSRAAGGAQAASAGMRARHLRVRAGAPGSRAKAASPGHGGTVAGTSGAATRDGTRGRSHQLGAGVGTEASGSPLAGNRHHTPGGPVTQGSSSIGAAGGGGHPAPTGTGSGSHGGSTAGGNQGGKASGAPPVQVPVGSSGNPAGRSDGSPGASIHANH
jgi:RNA polymerase sigma factor (sigma-70 family)